MRARLRSVGRPTLVVAYLREHDDPPGLGRSGSATGVLTARRPPVVLEHQGYGQVDLAPVNAALVAASGSVGVRA
jgi:hypothetical protein